MCRVRGFMQEYLEELPRCIEGAVSQLQGEQDCLLLSKRLELVCRAVWDEEGAR